MKKTIYLLNIGNYEPEITKITYHQYTFSAEDKLKQLKEVIRKWEL